MIKRVSHSRFEVEKNAKNKAYHFILGNGLLGKFVKFSKKSMKLTRTKDA